MIGLQQQATTKELGATPTEAAAGAELLTPAKIATPTIRQRQQQHNKSPDYDDVPVLVDVAVLPPDVPVLVGLLLSLPGLPGAEGEVVGGVPVAVAMALVIIVVVVFLAVVVLPGDEDLLGLAGGGLLDGSGGSGGGLVQVGGLRNNKFLIGEKDFLIGNYKPWQAWGKSTPAGWCSWRWRRSLRQRRLVGAVR